MYNKKAGDRKLSCIYVHDWLPQVCMQLRSWLPWRCTSPLSMHVLRYEHTLNVTADLYNLATVPTPCIWAAVN